MSRLVAAVGLAAGLALVPKACTGAQAAEEITVVMPNPSAIHVFPMWVAIGEGYFENEGLTVDVEAVDGSAPVLQAMAAGQADIGLPGPAPVLAARARGVDVVFIYSHFAQSVFGLVVREESPYQSPADLEGKIIGSAPPTARR